MRFLDELKKITSVLEENRVEFMLIGGFAVNFHGYNRATNDLDIWLKPTNENFLFFINALNNLDFDTDDLNTLVFDPKKTFIRIPFDNINIEFLTHIPGEIIFSDALKKAERMQIGESSIMVMGYDHLILNKKATNRPKDLNDVIEMERRKSKN